MKNQYFGDVNDYLKYSLLRAITSSVGEALLVCWMLTPPDARSDGNLVRYLTQADHFRAVDPPLFDALDGAISRGERTVDVMSRSQLLRGAVYHSTFLTDAVDARATYFARLWSLARDHSIVFFDPDNGLAPASIVKGRRNSAKYLFWDEFSQATEQGLSTVVYQHFPRVPREQFVQTAMQRMQAAAPASAIAAVYSSRVAYLVAAREEHAEGFNTAIVALRTAWGARLSHLSL